MTTKDTFPTGKYIKLFTKSNFKYEGIILEVVAHGDREILVLKMNEAQTIPDRIYIDNIGSFKIGNFKEEVSQ